MKKQNNQRTTWSQPILKVMTTLDTSEKGLSSAEASKRIHQFGENDISTKENRHGLSIFISQFTSPLILILIGAALVAFFVGEGVDAAVILCIVFLSGLLGFFQEYKAEKSLRALRKYITVKAKVIRSGEVIEIDAKDIVPGDIVHLNIGDMIPADIRLFNVDDFSTDESSLTGESLPVTKNIQEVSANKSLPQDLTNMAFMGTSVASGLGEGVVVSTGALTYFGKTAAYLKEKAPETGFHKGIKEFGGFLMKVTFVMTLFILVANAALGKSFFDSLLFAIALAVGITPEVLPILMTITLSNGALKMAKLKVITKTLPAVEDLGNMDTLCCDKTGTLTEGELTLYDYQNLDGEEDNQLLIHGLLCNSDQVGKGKRSFSNVIDKALWQSKKAESVKSKIKIYKEFDKNEFDFERRRMSVVVKNSETERNTFICKGAPESVLSVCVSVRIKGKTENLSREWHSKIQNKIDQYEAQGYRIIAVAEKDYHLSNSKKEDEKDLTLIGFLLFLDPPKSSAKESILTLKKLGVNIKVISGDSAGITRKICTDVGLTIAEDKVVTGTDLQKLSHKEFEHYCHKYNVFARVTPEQKYKIVACLNKENHVVGFLGDGINDAPALKAADVGISVDSAAEIAKEAASILLLQKSLNVLADGIREGRKIFGNITKYILNTISANFGNMFTVAASSVFLKFIPLLPSQILLNNFISDAPLLTIATDNVDEELLKKPKRWQIKMIFRFMVYFGIISSIFDLALILPMIFIFNTPEALFQTAWFVESALSEIIITFSIRTKSFFFQSKPSSWLVISSIATILLTFGITYLSLGTELFSFVPMPIPIVILIIGVLASYFMVTEIAKRWFFKKFEL